VTFGGKILTKSNNMQEAISNENCDALHNI